MFLRIVCVIVVAAMAAGCSGKATEEPAKPELSAAATATPPTIIDEETAKRIAILALESDLTADLMVLSAKLASRGGMKDGVRYGYTTLIDDADKARTKIIDGYTALIKEVEVVDLKAALKEGMTAEIAFYSTLSSGVRLGERTWFADLDKARDAIRQASSRIETERTLAKVQ